MAACNNATIRGNYGAIASGLWTDGFDVLGGYIMGRVNFDGSGKIRFRNGKATAFGEQISITGDGTYNLGANCVGTATLVLKSGGEVTGRVRIDMVVSGAASNPQIGAVYTSLTDGESGQFVLNKIRI